LCRDVKVGHTHCSFLGEASVYLLLSNDN
jgi:hypothetical protein